MKVIGKDVKADNKAWDSRGPLRQASVLIEALEPRLLYSADLLAGAVDFTHFESGLQEETQTRLSILARAESQGAGVNNGSTMLSAGEEGEQNPELSLSSHEPARLELIIIDSSTKDYQLFVDDIVNNAANEVVFKFALIEQGHDGIEQISRLLTQYTGLDALHLISHGDEGELNLGNTRLSLANLEQYSADISAWSEVFNPGGDILLYGCNPAAGIDGEQFVNSLAALTLSDVAASDDLTGHAGLGGDWQLEYHRGMIETQLAVSEPLQEQWRLLLAKDPASANDDPDSGDYIVIPHYADTFTLNADSSFEHIPITIFSGNDSFTYKANDGASDSKIATVALKVAGGDDQSATAVNQSMTILEGATNTVLTLTELHSSDPDTDDTTLIYTAADVSNGTLTINGSAWALGTNDTFTQQDIINGNILYSHDGTNSSSDSFSYKVEDPAGNQLLGQTFTITVTPLDDDTATVVNQSMTVVKGATDTVLGLLQLQSTDADTDDTTLIYTVGNVSNGTLTINGSAWVSGTNDTFTQQDIIDGTILYSHNDSNTTSDSFSYSVQDGAGNQVIGKTFAITVTPVDEETATAVNQSMTVVEGANNVVLTLTELQSTDVDTDDNTLLYTLANVSHGTLTVNGSAWVPGTNDTFTQQDIIDGNVLYSHDGSNTLSDSFNYTVEDGAGNQLSGQTFAITVIAVDDETATAVKQSMAVTEGANNVALTLNHLQSTDIDTDDNSLIYTVTNVSYGTLYINGSAWYKSGIGANNSFSQQDIIDGKVRYSHGGSHTFSDSFAYTVEDGAGNELVGQNFSITVIPVDRDNATVINQSMTVEEGAVNIPLTLAQLQSSDTQSSDNALVYTVGNAVNGSLTINGNPWSAGSNNSFTQQDIIDGKVLYSHDGSNTLTDNFAFSVKDVAGNLLSGQIFAVTVTPVDDDSAVVVNQTLMVAEGDSNIVLSLNELQSTDEDSDDTALLYTVTNVGNGSLTIKGSTWASGTNDNFTQQDILDGKVIYSHDGSNTSADSFRFSVTDPAGNQLGGQTFAIQVSRVDDPAVITGDTSFSGNEGDMVSGILNASDADGLTDNSYFSAGQGTYGSVGIDPETGAWSFTPADSNWFGSDSFMVTVTDDLGGMTEQLVTISLAGVDDAAVISGDFHFSGSEGDKVSGDINASDVDGLTDRTYFTATAASYGQVEINVETGTWFYTPSDSNWFGNDSFTVTVTDDLGGSTTELIRIELAAVNDTAIIAGDRTGSLLASTEASAELTTTGLLTIVDPDAGEASFVAETIVGHYGRLHIDSQGRWSYHANNNQQVILALDENEAMTELFTVSTVDGTKQQVTITINGVNDAPVILHSLSGQTLNPESQFDFILSENAFLDPDSTDTLAYSLIQADGSLLPGWLSFDSQSLTLSGTPGEEDAGTLALKLIADDGSLSVAGTFSLTVNPVSAVNAPLPINTPLIPVTENTEQTPSEKETVEEEKLQTESEILNEEAQTIQADKPDVLADASNNDLAPVSLQQINSYQHNRHEVTTFSSVPFERVVEEINEVANKSKVTEVQEINQKVRPLESLDLIRLNFSHQDPLELLTDEQVISRDNEHFFRELDQMRRELNESVTEEAFEADVVAEVTMGATLSFSVGVLAWVLRAGSLMASFLSVIPLWKQFDLMPVLGSQPVKTPDSCTDKETGQDVSMEETIFDPEEKIADESKD
ncbi:cadherin-like domain-containing protein [Thalassomonas haliotis]|uniref:DUF4347 domain-containing protein n=1 Tax=Thalassomonas haliotis TaxID=485448 RepID=A0ABY7VLE3_9GAMM|nr:cadherin-like domain-containing protein [Thalassomonas haliotis]WDE14098.1 DUF4347 domain-containing protein [Thalassomonas haliotis]